MKLIKVETVFKEYDKDTVIDIRDIEFERGKSYCILGPSGCGKSTLLSLLAGLTEPSSGSILVEGVGDLSLSNIDKVAYRRDKVSLIMQSGNLIEHLNVRDNIELLGYGKKVVQNVNTLTHDLGMSSKEGKLVRTLSGGEKQRVNVIGALAVESEILLCDEPTASLNSKLAKVVIDRILLTHRSYNNLLVVVTHDESMSEHFDVVYRFAELLADNKATTGGIL